MNGVKTQYLFQDIMECSAPEKCPGTALSLSLSLSLSFFVSLCLCLSLSLSLSEKMNEAHTKKVWIEIIP